MPPFDLKNVIETLPTDEKISLKLQAFLSLGQPSLYAPFLYQGFVINIVDISKEGNLLKIIAHATKNGELVKVDNPLYFMNPPILVPDGTTYTDNRGRVNNNYKEDLVEAIKQMVGECIKVTTR